MKQLIAALQIFLKYSDTEYPTHCEHDILHVCVDPELVTDEDKNQLHELGFSYDSDHFYSYKYGSC